MDKRRRICILGCTGSIGEQAIDVVRKHSDKLEICGLSCGTRASDMLSIAKEFDVHDLCIGKPESVAEAVREEIKAFANEENDGFYGEGSDGLLRLVDECDPDIVVNSLVGAAGMRSSYHVLEKGIVLALANKESLVVAGDLLMPMAHKLDSSYPVFGEDAVFKPQGTLMPIDSEHGAIYQCLLGENMAEVDTLWVTASGGPFRGMSKTQIENVTAKEALAHPTWNMGPKITIDSATLMNKGLEVIEAHHLFGAPYKNIEVVVQPQSAIHSMVEFNDGSVKAHLGATNMRIPIQFAISYPERWDSPVERIDFRKLASLDFAEPDIDVFRCLALAKQAGEAGGTLPCAMNAANEVAVAAFLAGDLSFLGIPDTVEATMLNHKNTEVQSIDQLVEIDAQSRDYANQLIYK